MDLSSGLPPPMLVRLSIRLFICHTFDSLDSFDLFESQWPSVSHFSNDLLQNIENKSFFQLSHYNLQWVIFLMTHCKSHHDLQWVIFHCNKNQSLTNWVIMTFIQWVILLMTFIQWVIFDSLDSSVPHSSIRCYSRPACFVKHSAHSGRFSDD